MFLPGMGGGPICDFIYFLLYDVGLIDSPFHNILFRVLDFLGCPT